jgi:hypothetical protein
MITLDQALDVVEQLTTEEQEMLMEILRRRSAEEARREISRDAKASLMMVQSGNLKPQSADEVIARLRQSLRAGNA